MWLILCYIAETLLISYKRASSDISFSKQTEGEGKNEEELRR